MASRDGRIICTIGRMNPPTSGHLFLIQTLFEVAVKDNSQVVIFISNSEGRDETKENPLLCENKKIYVETMIEMLKGTSPQFQEIPYEVVCGNPFLQLCRIVREKRPEQLNVFLGDEPEKVKLGNSITEEFLGVAKARIKKGANPDEIAAAEEKAREKNEYKKVHYAGISVDVKYLKRVGGVSATMVRGLVKNKNKDTFNHYYEGVLPEFNKNKLFYNIEQGLERLNRNYPHSNGKRKQSKSASARTYKSASARTYKSGQNNGSNSNMNRSKPKTKRSTSKHASR